MICKNCEYYSDEKNELVEKQTELGIIYYCPACYAVYIEKV